MTKQKRVNESYNDLSENHIIPKWPNLPRRPIFPCRGSYIKSGTVGINHLGVLADSEENNAAQTAIFDQRLVKLLKAEICSKVSWSFSFMGFGHYRCCFPETKTEKHLPCYSP